jgi:multidrug efflux pump subunit AcrB
MADTLSDNIQLRLSGGFKDLASLRDMPLSIGDRLFRLGDLATVTRGYAEPGQSAVFWQGRKSIGLAVSMEEGGDIIKLGRELNRALEKIRPELPAGMDIYQISDQPKVVDEAITDFISSLRDAVLIVLTVSFLSLGLRTGAVVALCIPLVLAGTFFMMYLFNLNLHKVSLGSLILALGLLVDDEIIAVEMMSVKLEEGLSRFKAAIAAYGVTAIPMLTGTLVTCAGFIPMGFSKGLTAEFTRSIFPVVSIAILFSWLVAVTVTPLAGFHLMKDRGGKPGGHRQSRFQLKFKQLLAECLKRRQMVVLATGLIFCLSLGLLTFVKRDFFPPSTRPEIIIELTLPEGASLKASQAVAERFSAMLAKESGLETYTYYVGQGAPRFIQTMEPILPRDNYVQFVIKAKEIKARKELEKRLSEILAEYFPDVLSNLKLIQTGPPADYPVMLRVSGYDHDKVKVIALEVAEIMRREKTMFNVNLNWHEKSKYLHLEIDQDKLRTLGLDRRELSLYLHTAISGQAVAEFYQADQTVDIVFRMKGAKESLEAISQLPVYLPGGQYVTLEQIASGLTLGAEEGTIWRRNLKPTLSVSGSVSEGTGNDMTQKIYDQTKALRARLPFGYSIELDGTLEQSNISMAYIFQTLPFMVICILTILMFQLKRLSLVLLAMVTAPLGLIGVSLGMFIFDRPLGFVAQLGILSLSGMIIRNSVILIVQIEEQRQMGQKLWTALIDSTAFRFRPIMLTSLVAILAMIPLMSSSFWGPMAVAIASGLLVATALTLLVLPCLYAMLPGINLDDQTEP